MNAEPIGADHRPDPDANPEAADVAAEMAAIFGAEAGAERANLPRSRAVVPVLAPGRGRRRLAIASGLAVLVLAVCVYLSLGRRPALQPFNPPVARTAHLAERDRTPVAIRPPAAQIAPVVVQSAPAPEPKARSRPAVVKPATASAIPAASRSPHRDRAVARGHGPRIRRCGDGSSEARAWCLQPAILSADRQLRIAYDRAVSRGADRRGLLYYRRQWMKLQRRATREPEDAVRQMRALARDLASLGR